MACRHNIARGVDAGHDLSRNQPVAKSRITQRSFTYIMSRPCAQARAPVNVTCSTLSSILVNFPGLMTVSSRSINAIAAPDSIYPENTIFLECAVISTNSPHPAVKYSFLPSLDTCTLTAASTSINDRKIKSKPPPALKISELVRAEHIGIGVRPAGPSWAMHPRFRR